MNEAARFGEAIADMKYLEEVFVSDAGHADQLVKNRAVLAIEIKGSGSPEVMAGQPA